MILMNDGEFIAGTTWVVGYEPTGKNSVKNKGGLWLNEVGMEDTKEETTMIDLSKAEIGEKFIAAGPMFEDIVFELVFICGGEYVFKEGDSLHISDGSGVMNGVVTLYKKHEPRWWLKKLPDADLFRGEFLAMDKNNFWYSSSCDVTIIESYWRGNGTHYMISGIKMPQLTGDEWQQSKISIADLRDWQDEYINV